MKIENLEKAGELKTKLNRIDECIKGLEKTYNDNQTPWVKLKEISNVTQFFDDKEIRERALHALRELKKEIEQEIESL